MTNDEQQQVNAMRAFFERQCGNLASEGANAAALAESLAIRLRALEAEFGEYRKRHESPDKTGPEQSNVVPITEPAA